jgi:hypothetical protein
MQMAVPIELVGAWRRSGLLLDGVRKVDFADVVWLQTPEWFVDIRLLIDPKLEVPTEGVPDFFYKEFAFAGVTKWEAPQITWSHLIDFSLEPAVDSNPAYWEDGVVCERGKATVDGREAAFTEEWLRMTDDDVVWSADTGEREARIEVGRFAVEIIDDRPNGGFMATRYHKQGDEWVKFGSVTA